MLPKDAEKRCKDVRTTNQSLLDPHLWEKPRKEKMSPYTDEVFCDAAIEWLVSTGQVCNSNFSNLVLLLMKITANPGLRTLIVSKHDKCCCSCNQWSKNPRLPPNSTGHY